MIRILQCVNNMHRAGLETILMNYYRRIDRSEIQFDFLMHRSQRSDYDDEIERMGGRIFRAPRLYPQNYPAYFKYMKAFFAEHPEHRIIHSHIDAMSYLPLLAAKKAGVPIRIAHSHSMDIDRDFKYLLKQYFRYRLPEAANVRLACGEETGRFLYRKYDFEVLYNAVDAKKFHFDPQLRMEKRHELGLEDKFVIGHVGRFAYAKNHEFLLDVFAEIAKHIPEAILVLCGSGEKLERIRALASELGIAAQVRFMGSVKNMAAIYQAMDVFVMPSLFEGMPVAAIEAQYAGLPCILSDTITREILFTDRCSMLSLEAPASVWAEHIASYRRIARIALDHPDPKFDIDHAFERLMSLYFQLLKNCKNDD